MLKFYENSYFWFSKRYYFFNTLPSNLIKSTYLQKKTNIVRLPEDALSKITLKNNSILSFLLNSTYLNLSQFGHFSSCNTTFTDTSFSDSIDRVRLDSNYNFKDLYFLFNDTDLLTKENLNLLY